MGESALNPPALTLAPSGLPTRLTLAALAVGLGLGWLLSDSTAIGPLLALTGPVGALWLHALQMTIIPLVAAMLVGGVVRIAATAAAGPLARRTLAAIFAALTAAGAMAALVMPLLLDAWPPPAAAPAMLAVDSGPPPPLPALGDFVSSLVAPNVFAAAAETAMLPLVVFFLALAVAITRLPAEPRERLTGLFDALGQAMLLIIGWVLALAPVGVFALALGVAASSRGGAFAALGHYIVLVSAIGLVILVAAYLVAWIGAGQPPWRFARAVLPAQTVALSTQSSLASLPAMLVGCQTLGLRAATADFVLPLAVAIFRVTGPAMNLAVALYVAKVSGVTLTSGVLAAAVAVSVLTSVSSVSLPGAITFFSNIGPVAYVLGVPLEPLALLVAVEMLPDIVRTVSNVTMDVAVTATVDRSETSQAS
jgi:proton glutamate symport protein